MKLKNKFAIIMVFNIIIPLFLLGSISIIMFSKNLLEQNKNVVKMINFNFYDQFMEFEKNSEAILDSFSNSPTLKSALNDKGELGKASLEEAKNEAISIMKNNPNIRNIVVENQQGKILMNSFAVLEKDVLDLDYFYHNNTETYLRLLKKDIEGGRIVFFIDIKSFVNGTLVDLELDDKTHLFIVDTASKSIVLHNKLVKLRADELKNQPFFEEMLKAKTGFFEYTFNGDSKIAYVKEYGGQLFGVSLSKAHIFEVIANIKNIIYAFMAIFTIIAIIVSFSFSKYLTTPMLKFSNNLKKLSEGIVSENLYINTRDEIGDIASNYNKFIDKFKDMIKEIKEGATTISTSTNNMKGAHRKLVAKSSDQTAEIKHTTENIKEISAIVLSNTQKTMEANKITESTKKRTEKVGDMSVELKMSIDKIDESSKKIEKIVEVIDEISFQTNLLALNAAVEAANTGEEGKGFAVVATEVRNLSKRSSKAANEIRNLIKENVNLVSDGSKIVDTTIHEMHDIVNDVKQVSEVISNLANSVNDQQEGIKHINNTLEKLNEVTRMNAWIAEETSASTDILYKKSNNFLNLVNFFKISNK